MALETSCPLDLVERAESAGVITELAHKLKVRPEQVRAAAAEFVSYWTIGEGMGRRRPHWMAKLREHVRRGAHQGRLPEVPPVAELDPETGLPRAQTPRPEVAQRMAAIKARDDARFRELAAKASTHARSPEQVARDREAIARGDVRALLEGIGGA